MSPIPSAEIFALLDDCQSGEAAPTSRLYRDHVRTHRCEDPAELEVVWERVEADQRAGLHAVLLADYEWGARMLGAGHGRWTPAELGGRVPALQVLMFRSLQRLSREGVEAWLAAAEGQEDPAPAGAAGLSSRVDRGRFDADLARIQERLRAGDTYQVNYTLGLDFDTYGDPLALYRRLRVRQPVAYGALLSLGEGRHVLSLSPELFVRHGGEGEARRLQAQPMKGTAPHTVDPLPGGSGMASDRKTRAENVMIVDLLRNDLGRVAEAGSVIVPALFTEESFPTLTQLTSTVLARPRADLRFPEFLRALFPCGSITGAPKHRTMELIADLEQAPRGPYCGALGWVDAPGSAPLGPFCLAVAIRTLDLQVQPGPPMVRTGRLGVGAGIVLGSEAAAEYQEVALKAAFLTGLDPGFALLETLLRNPAGEIPHLDLHLARLIGSAAALGFACIPASLCAELLGAAASLPPGVPGALRLTLAKDGRSAVAARPLGAPWGADSPLVTVGVALEPLAADPVLAHHKTTWRPRYDAGLAEARARGWFDLLFLNAAGELVEGARTSVFLKRYGRWLTPPLSLGALPGIQRGLLLADPAWAAREAVLTLHDLQEAEALVVCNALRGPMRARLEGPLPV
jgi:para-aminobenzoate synthetase / 4-amino-4-deoxychorismate lyase